jgi:hypothetical protein
MSEYVGFAGFDDGPTDGQLNSVSILADQQLELEDRAAALLRELESVTAQLKKVAECDLPAAMSIAGMEKFTLTGGRTVSIDTKVSASPTKEQQPVMLRWLEENEYGDIIKHEVKIGFGKGDDEKARRFLTWVGETFPSQKIDDKKFVHPQTLGAFVREQLQQGVDLPEEFGVVVLTKAVIKRPKTESTL